MGVLDDGSDSVAVQVASEDHWPDMEALVLVVSDHKKDVGSTVGMQQTVNTSELFQQRLRLVPERMRIMEKAIMEKDFKGFAELTMKDSNQFHATCLDTYPPVFYLNDISKSIISFVTAYNQVYEELFGSQGASYTFDAGPNAVIFLPRENIGMFLQVLGHFFPPSPQMSLEDYFGSGYEFCRKVPDDIDKLISDLSLKISMSPHGSLKRVISTRVGGGPQVLATEYNSNVSLISESGMII
jgi:diphosphomevalonate decarboxylase